VIQNQNKNEYVSVKATLAKSSLTGIAQFFINTILVFFTIPTFVRILGTEAYGVFSLVALLGSFNTFANLGLNSSLVRFLAQQGKSQESDLDIIVTFIVLLSILLPLTAIGFAFQDQILVHVFGIPNEMVGDARWLLVSTLTCNILVLLGQTFTAILDSQQKIYLTNSYQMVYNFSYWVLILLALFLGYALKGVAVATLAATALWFAIVAFSAVRTWHGISFSGLGTNGVRIAKKQLSYGTQIYAAGVVGFFHEPITKILVSRFVGVPAAGMFDIGLRVRNQVVGLVTKLLSPLYPAISQLADPGKVRSLVHDVEQKTFLMVLPLAAIVVLTAKPAASLVFHANIDPIAVTIAFIVVAYLVCSTTVIPIYLFLMAKGYPSKNIMIQSVNVIVNAVVFFTALRWLQYYAAVAANALAIVSTFVILVFLQRRYLESMIFESVGQVLKVLLTFLCSLGFGYLATNLVTSSTWKLAVAPVVVAAVTIVSYRELDILKVSDIRRYLGEGTTVSRLTASVFCKSR
jgi:O-antigen/teichoic acid export membrane protein